MRVQGIQQYPVKNTSFRSIKLSCDVPNDFILRDIAKKDDFIKLQNLIEQEDDNDCDVLLTYKELADEELIQEIDEDNPFKYLKYCKFQAKVGNQIFQKNFCTSTMSVIENACNFAQKVKNDPITHHTNSGALSKDDEERKAYTDRFRLLVSLFASSEADNRKNRFSTDIRKDFASCG